MADNNTIVIGILIVVIFAAFVLLKYAWSLLHDYTIKHAWAFYTFWAVLIILFINFWPMLIVLWLLTGIFGGVGEYLEESMSPRARVQKKNIEEAIRNAKK